MAHTLTAQNFDDTLHGDKVVLVDFWAEWCGPCKMMSLVIDSIHGKYDGRAIIAKVNVDEENGLAQKYQITMIPTIIIFKNNEIAERLVGGKSQRDLEDLLDKYI